MIYFLASPSPGAPPWASGPRCSIGSARGYPWANLSPKKLGGNDQDHPARGGGRSQFWPETALFRPFTEGFLKFGSSEVKPSSFPLLIGSLDPPDPSTGSGAPLVPPVARETEITGPGAPGSRGGRVVLAPHFTETSSNGCWGEGPSPPCQSTSSGTPPCLTAGSDLSMFPLLGREQREKEVRGTRNRLGEGQTEAKTLHYRLFSVQ